MSTIYHYTECGLDNVYVEGIEIHKDDSGEEVVTIPNLVQLHRVITEALVMRGEGLTPKEFRYLRTELRKTQADIATFLHVDTQTIGRWERAEVDIDPNAMTLLRQLCIKKFGFAAPDIENLSVASTKIETAPNVEIKSDVLGTYRWAA